MKMRNPYPTEHIDNPKRRAERMVYGELAASRRPGAAIFEAYPPGGEEIDFAVLVEGAGRYAISVKGGIYILDAGEWYLEEVTGEPSRQRDPLRAIFDAGMAWHRHLDAHTPKGIYPFVVPILAFPDLEQGHVLEDTPGKAIVVCGLDGLLERIIDRADERIHHPLTADDVERDVGLTLPGGNRRPDAASSGGRVGHLGMETDRVVIHADTVNIYTTAS